MLAVSLGLLVWAGGRAGGWGGGSYKMFPEFFGGQTSCPKETVFVEEEPTPTASSAPPRAVLRRAVRRRVFFFQMPKTVWLCMRPL